MVDREKTIKGLEKLREDLGYGLPDRSNVVMEYLNSLTDAIDLLKEQEPVEPVQHLVYTTKGWFCGACDGRLNRLGKYCSFCGRKVKWE